MKTYRLGALLAPVVLASVIAANSPQTRGPLDGVWTYVPPGRGQAIYHGRHYIMFTLRPDSAPASGPLDEAAQARLFRTMTLQAGTFSIADTIVTMFTEQSKNPAAEPRTWRWSYFINGDTLSWHVLNADGKVTSSGKSVRVR